MILVEKYSKFWLVFVESFERRELQSPETSTRSRNRKKESLFGKAFGNAGDTFAGFKLGLKLSALVGQSTSCLSEFVAK